MADEWSLRPLYILLFAAGVGILLSLAMNTELATEFGEDAPRRTEATLLR